MHVLSGAPSHLPAGMFPRLAHYRHQVFIEKLGWQLNVSNHSETDQFDGPDTVYVVAEEEDGTISGCARLLPTNGPYLLADVFPEMLNGTAAPRDPEVWELSRFAAVNFVQRDTTPLAQYSRSTAVHLMGEVMSCAAAHGAKRLVTVTVLAMERLMRRAGIRSHRMGPPRVQAGEPIYACWIEL